MAGVYKVTATMDLNEDEEIPPPIIDGIIEACNNFYKSAADSIKKLPGWYFAPGDNGRANFLYGALENDGILPDEAISVIAEKMGKWAKRNRKGISRSDFLLSHYRIREFVGDYAQQQFPEEAPGF
ncbi:MAG: hypothetical protein JXC85_03410 [Candidatus Aenigmarchaeota archaeon]|nr:hypothetical protein [Candidatus Aenigmarchaeota archaeon]